MKYVLDNLEKLLKIPSPTGNTEKAVLFVEKMFKELGLGTQRTNKGALIATIQGNNKDKEVTLSAHVDTLGGMVKETKDNGRIKISQLGGYVWDKIEGENVVIETMEEKTFEFLAIDMAAPRKGQTSDEFSVTICAKDSSGPYDYQLRKRLINLARDKDLDYQIDIYPYYGSDGSAALKAGYDFKVGLIGPGVDASHSFERTHKDAIKYTIDLSIAYLTK